LKAKKAEKAVVDAAVKELLALKAEFKAVSGKDWSPALASAPQTTTEKPSSTTNADTLSSQIKTAGDKVRDLKTKKAEKAVIDAAVKELLALKAEFKSVSGKDWSPALASAPQATIEKSSSTTNADTLSSQIKTAGDKVRDLKAKKAEKAVIDAAVKELLALKAEFKAVSGKDWSPAMASAPQATSEKPSSAVNVDTLSSQVKTAGDKVRDLKAKKAEKAVVDAAVKELLALKAEFKAVSGKDWSPALASAPQTTTEKPSSTTNADTLSSQIKTAGDKVRDLKTKKAEKAVIDAAVKELLALKAEFKSVSGKDWSPALASAPQATIEKSSSTTNADTLSSQIKTAGDKVRDLKAKKAEKAVIDAAVKELLALKAEFKAVSGKDWSPAIASAPQAAAEKPSAAPQKTEEKSGQDNSLGAKIKEAGDKVRDLKAKKADKAAIDSAVKELLALKAEFKEANGVDWVPEGGAPAARPSKPAAQAAKPKKAEKKEEKKKEPKKVEEKDESSGLKKQTRLGLESKKEENLSEWYSQVITKSEMIEYYDVSGCYILRPWSYAIWEFIVAFFDGEIKKNGVQNCYFPMFVSNQALEREKAHIADFAPEVAWVTKSGSSDLAEPIAIRPTSETVMYPAYAKWIQSHRDLPMRLNQWNNVVRWEFKHPTPFLRTREFLWQEGHSAFATFKEAEEEVLYILDLYSKIYTDLLAIPVVKGRKTEKEKFAGGDFTTTVEAFIATSGRGIQGGTSHHLGQNFSKMFEIVFEDPETQEKKFVYQNSWGLTTRTIGVMVMVHGDDKGLVLPPNAACYQVVIVPCGINVNVTEDEKKQLIVACEAFEKKLTAAGVRVRGDYRDNYSPGWKFNHWELKGVPIRIEIGPRDVKTGQYVAVRRDNGEKITYPLESAEKDVSALLKDIHQSLFNKATKQLEDHTVILHDFKNFLPELDKKNIILAPFCGEPSCEENIKKESTREEVAADVGPAMGAKSLCVPFEQPDALGKAKPVAECTCIFPKCSLKPKFYCLFGRSY